MIIYHLFIFYKAKFFFNIGEKRCQTHVPLSQKATIL